MSDHTVIAAYSLCPLLGIEQTDLRSIDAAAGRAPDDRRIDGRTGEYVHRWAGLDRDAASQMAARVAGIAAPRMRVRIVVMASEAPDTPPTSVV